MTSFSFSCFMSISFFYLKKYNMFDFLYLFDWFFKSMGEDKHRKGVCSKSRNVCFSLYFTF